MPACDLQQSPVILKSLALAMFHALLHRSDHFLIPPLAEFKRQGFDLVFMAMLGKIVDGVL
jgi:hypothetical protein